MREKRACLLLIALLAGGSYSAPQGHASWTVWFVAMAALLAGVWAMQKGWDRRIQIWLRQKRSARCSAKCYADERQGAHNCSREERRWKTSPPAIQKKRCGKAAGACWQRASSSLNTRWTELG